MSQENIEDLTQNFSLFDDWEERYAYLIDLGKALPGMAESLKSEENLVRGCTSRVWMVCTKDDAGHYHFLADSDAFIVRGLIAVLLAAYDGRTAQDIKDVDIHGAFTQMGLDQHLSPNRRSGFFAMVERIRSLRESDPAIHS
jgi:cysteine desulfuration protein SufE